MGLNHRLNRLERRLPESGKPPVIMWVIDPDADVPEWAFDAVRPLLPLTPGGVTFAEWRRGEGAALVASWGHHVSKVEYTVTPDGCEPVEPSL